MISGGKTYQNGHSSHVRSLDRVNVGERDAGGKALRLADLRRAGFSVPKGFVVLASAYRAMRSRGATEQDGLPLGVRDSVLRMYDEIFGDRHCSVAVRSSAISEDGASAAFAGIFESVLDVTAVTVEEAILTVYRSTGSQHARDYTVRQHDGGPLEMAVVVQEQITPRWAGVAFTSDPVTGAPNPVVEFVQGRSEQILTEGATASRIVLDGNLAVSSQHYAHEQDKEFIKNVTAVATEAVRAADVFGKPQDIEWIIDGTGTLFIVQSRDITSLPASGHQVLSLHVTEKPAATGLPISAGVVTGPVCILPSSLSGDEAEALITSESIAVAQLLSSDHISALIKAAGIVTSEASLLSHPAVTARELRIPCVGDIANAVGLFSPNEILTVDGGGGHVYRGQVAADTMDDPASAPRLLYYNPDRISALSTERGPVLYERVDDTVFIYTDDVAAEQANQQSRDAVAEHLRVSPDTVLIDQHGLWEGPRGPSVVYSQCQVLNGLRKSPDTAQLLQTAEQVLEQLDVPGLTSLLDHIDKLAREHFSRAVNEWNEFTVSEIRDRVDGAAASLEKARSYAGDVVEAILQVLSQVHMERVLERLDSEQPLTLFDLYRITHKHEEAGRLLKATPEDQRTQLAACIEIVRTLEASKGRRLGVLTIGNTSFFDILEGMDQAGFGDVIEHYGW